MGQYLCVDLKSFYASCECVMRGLDPFKTPLLVVDIDRGPGTVVLAVSPYLKANYHLPGRCALHEVPKGIPYLAARPRMKKYIEFSVGVYQCFLKYISPEDIHVYSIDEAFINAEPYLKLYDCSAMEIGKMLLKEIHDTLGLTATCGGGENLFLAKVALDILAKKSVDGMAYLNREDFVEQLWDHRPLTDIWQIGKGTARHLAELGIETLHDIAFYGRDKMVKEFGIIGNDLYDHAWGDDDVRIADIKKYIPKARSLTQGQVLFQNYDKKMARTVLLEMVYTISLDLIKKESRCSTISLSISYAKELGLGMNKSLKLPYAMSSYTRLKEYFLMLFDYVEELPIRKISISLSSLSSNRQLCLFEDDTEVYEAINKVREKHGKNAVVLGVSLEKGSTLKARNKLVGGHHE